MDNIFALATNQYKSTIAIIKISGKDILKDIKNLFQITENIKPYHSNCLNINDPSKSEILDKIILLYQPAPHSFTGEDIIELHTHASNYIITRIFSILSSHKKYKMASPGEFSLRAFYNNKMDLLQAEAINDLIQAETHIQAKQAITFLNGEISQYYQSLKEEIINIMVQIEAYIDFPDEELPNSLKIQSFQLIDKLKIKIQEYLADNHKGEIIKEGIKTLIIGAPNAGKSSLINHYSQKEVAIVSDIQGTTRDLIEVIIDHKGFPIKLIDSAGLRDAQDAIEEIGIKKTISMIPSSDVVILLISPDNMDLILSKYSQHLIEKKYIIIAFNKIDLCNLTDPIIQKIKSELRYNQTIIPISITQNINLDKVLDQIIAFFTSSDNNTSSIISNQRQREALQKSLNTLENQLSLDHSIEIIAEDLREVIDHISEVTGYITNDEIINNIFSNFCIGK